MHILEAHHRPTRHYEARVTERALRSSVEAFLMSWGTETRGAGATHITLRRRDLPFDLQRTEQAIRAEGWIIVAADDGSLVTCYRRKDAWRFVRRKSHTCTRRRSKRTT